MIQAIKETAARIYGAWFSMALQPVEPFTSESIWYAMFLILFGSNLHPISMDVNNSPKYKALENEAHHTKSFKRRLVNNAHMPNTLV